MPYPACYQSFKINNPLLVFFIHVYSVLILERLRVQCVQNISSLCFLGCFHLLSAPYFFSLFVQIRFLDLLAYIATVAIHLSGSTNLILLILIFLNTCVIYWYLINLFSSTILCSVSPDSIPNNCVIPCLNAIDV